MIAHSSPPAPDTLDDLFRAARDHLAEARRLHGRLATALMPDGPDERALLALMAERPALQARIGAAVLRYLAEEEPPAAEGVDDLPPDPVEVEPPEAGPPEAALVPGEPEVCAHEADAAAAPETDLVAEAPPAAPCEPTEPPAPVPASATSLGALCLSPRWTRGDRPGAPGNDAVTTLVERLAAAFDVRGPAAMADRCADLARKLADSPATGSDLHALATAWTGLARSVQERLPAGRPVLDRAFSAVVQLVRARQPGKVHGLSRAHRPRSSSWREDGLSALATLRPAPAPTDSPERALTDLEALLARADATADRVQAAIDRAKDAGVALTDPRLIRLLTPRLDTIRVGKAYSPLRKAIRDAQAAEREGAMDLVKADTALDPTWPGLRHTAGKRVAMIGGDLREERRARLAEAFGVASLDWVSGSQHRQVQALAARVRKGSLDLVWILTAYCSHSVSDLIVAAAGTAGVPYVNVRSGYGIQNVRAAVDALG